MKAEAEAVPFGMKPRWRRAPRKSVLLAVALMTSGRALASGGLEDAIADVMVWVVIVFAPILAVTLFWVVHVWPERVAHARHHPQKDAIQALCLLSLVFGGLLWPLAMLWAYMKPLRFRLEGGGGVVEPDAHPADTPPDPHFDEAGDAQAARVDEGLIVLRQRVALLQGRLDALVERDRSNAQKMGTPWKF
ncbi:MAG TPA: DUF3302 domain-containing protein [Lysobacter sp.]